MLIEFTTRNFRSFRDEATLSLVAEKLKNNPKETFPLYKEIDLLPVAGVFGPNASGKSNLFKALFFFKLAIENTNYLNMPIYSIPLFQPFMLDEKSSSKSSYFQIVLWDKKSSTEYRYGFEITKKAILSEWLIESSKAKKNITTKTLFTREGDVIKVHNSMVNNPGTLLKEVHPHGLALTVFAQLANPTSSKIFNLIRDNLFISDGTFDLQHLLQVAFEILHKNPQYKALLLSFLKNADLAISDLALNRNLMDKSQLQQFMKVMPTGLADAMGTQEMYSMQILTSHKIHGTDKVAPFEMAEFESVGTQRMFGLGAILMQVLDKGGTLVIDEFGNSLHPFLSKEIIKIFQSKKQNPNNAQLVFSCHDTFLLSSKGPNLRRDQIWFTEKDKTEAAKLHSLAEYKTKKELEVAKNYLEGRFGAVPVTTFED